jgi:hypothetical protein
MRSFFADFSDLFLEAGGALGSLRSLRNAGVLRFAQNDTQLQQQKQIPFEDDKQERQKAKTTYRFEPGYLVKSFRSMDSPMAL